MTLQEKYNAINEGTFSKQQFLRDARLAFPQIISQFNSYEDASKILKNRSVIAEVEKKPEPIKFDPADNIASDVLDQGIKAELEKKGLPVNQTPSKEEYLAAKKKAVKNLSKDILFYKNVKTMAVSKSDQMQKSKVQVSENTIKALAELINEAKLAEEMTVSGKLQDILDAETPKVAQGAAIALDALKKFYASAENLTKKLEKAYKITGPFMAPALAAAVVDQINGIVTKPYKAEMPKAKMVNIAKINDFETLSKETGISVDDLKAMQKQLKQGTVALPTANEAKTSRRGYNAPAEWKKIVNEGENPAYDYGVSQDSIDTAMQQAGMKERREQEVVTIDGKPVFVSSIEVDGFDPDDRRELSDIYATYAEFEDGTPLTDDQLSDLDKKYPYVVRTAAIDYLSEGKRKRGYNALAEWKKLVNEGENPAYDYGESQDSIDAAMQQAGMKEASEGYFVNGKEVDYYSIEFIKDFDSQGYPVMYADQARFKDGSILDDSEIEVLNSQYFENDYVNPEDFYDEDEFQDR
jgi:hypothetical protein